MLTFMITNYSLLREPVTSEVKLKLYNILWHGFWSELQLLSGSDNFRFHKILNGSPTLEACRSNMEQQHVYLKRNPAIIKIHFVGSSEYYASVERKTEIWAIYYDHFIYAIIVNPLASFSFLPQIL